MVKFPLMMLSVFILTALESGGQDLQDVDSLVTELGLQDTDSARCRLMLEIATFYKTTDTIIAFSFLERSRAFAEFMEDKSLLGRNFEIRGEMHTHFGSYEQAIIEFDRAMSAYYEADNDQGYYETMKDKGNVYLFMSEYSQAMNYYETALEYYRKTGIAEGASRCLNNMGIIYKNRGEYLKALGVYEESINIISLEENPMQVAQGYINMGNVFVYLGSYERALEYYQLALRIAEKEGSVKEYALSLLNTGVVQNKCGHYREADDMYRSALSIARDMGDPVLISNCLVNIGTNYSEMGRLEEALEYVEKGLAMKIDLGDDRIISNCYIHMAEIHFKMEDYSKAIELFQTAIPTKESLQDKEGLVRSYLGLARVHLRLENYRAANMTVDRALIIAQEIKAREHIANGYKIKQEIAAIRGDFRSAYQYAMEFSRISDSLMDESTSNAVMEMEFKYRSSALEKENENLRIQSALTAELMKKRNAFMYSIAGIAILLAAAMILGAYFIRRLRQSSMKLEEKNLVITKQNMKLDTLNRTKDRMMSIIAHDLRGTIGNQLTAIEVLHRLEKSDHKEIDQRKLLGNLKHSASYSLELLENLLHWSRLEENDNYFHPEMIKLERVLSSSISLFDETARNKTIVIRQDISDSMMIYADRIMLETIIRNLISNAIKFSKQGGSISVSATEENSFVHIVVEDQGTGMTEEQLQKVMSNGGFTKRGTLNEKGAGIGMTLVREFTALHHGRLDIESKPGEGTRVSVDFPKQM